MTVIISDAGVQFPDASVQPSALTTGTQTIAGAKTFSGNATFSGLVGDIKSGTAVTTSGTAVTFTGIPSGVKRITVMLNAVSTSATSNIVMRGGSGSVEATGYGCGFASITGTNTCSANVDTTSHVVATPVTAATTYSGSVVMTKLSGDLWVITSTARRSDGVVCNSASEKTFAGAIDRVSLTTANGTDTFDAGSVNILYEG